MHTRISFLEEKVGAMVVVWRDEPPGAGEWDAPDILGWAFRGAFWPPDEYEVAVAAEKRRALCRAAGEPYPDEYLPLPTETDNRGVVLELMVRGDDGLPLWAVWRRHLFHFRNLRGQWCPIRVRQLVIVVEGREGGDHVEESK